MSGIVLNCNVSLLTALHFQSYGPHGFLPYDHLCQMLIAATSLVDLSICSYVIVQPRLSLPRIVMLRLQSLTLHSAPRCHAMMDIVLRTLTCPSLETMALFFSPDSSLPRLEYSLSSARYPSLRDLTFHDFSFSALSFIAYNIPTITTFTMTHTGVPRHLLPSTRVDGVQLPRQTIDAETFPGLRIRNVWYEDWMQKFSV